VAAVAANRLEIPCAREKWDSWVSIGGPRILFRYYKFLIRGYEHDEGEMAYIAGRLLGFWRKDPEDTVRTGRETLQALVSSGDERKVERLRQAVLTSFAAATLGGVAALQDVAARPSTPLDAFISAKRTKAARRSMTKTCSLEAPAEGVFLSAGLWWQHGWLQVLAR